MLERGLLPDFSPEVIAEANAIAGPALEMGPSVRDLRGLPWASIDNDDSPISTSSRSLSRSRAGT